MNTILEYLAPLIACDSQNPPRAITPEAAMFGHIRQVLDGRFEITVTDHGKGRVTMLAVRGEPAVLFNCHLDTVPVGEGWSVPPLELTVKSQRVYGRGACDIKGAAACLLAVAGATEAPMALLFTTDEEGAEGCCVAEFLNTEAANGFTQVVVCEPTNCEAVLAHRGFLSVKGRFQGIAGHSSEPRALTDNANHRMARWTAAALDYCAAEADAGRPTCFNLGRVEGGTKSNVIANEARVHYSARLGPGRDNEALFEALSALAGNDAEWRVPFSGPPLPAAGGGDGESRAFAQAAGLSLGEPVDFWTEASLFSAAGMPALVLGPGDIEQAHAVDEWVALEQLETAFGLYRRVVTNHD